MNKSFYSSGFIVLCMVLNVSIANAELLTGVEFKKNFVGKSFRYNDIYDGEWRVASYYRNHVIIIFEKGRIVGKGRWWLKGDRICSRYRRGKTVCGRYSKTGIGRFKTELGYKLQIIR